MQEQGLLPLKHCCDVCLKPLQVNLEFHPISAKFLEKVHQQDIFFDNVSMKFKNLSIP